MNLASILAGAGTSLANNLLQKGLKYGMSLIDTGKKGMSDKLSRVRMSSRVKEELGHIKTVEKMLEEDLDEIMND